MSDREPLPSLAASGVARMILDPLKLPKATGATNDDFNLALIRQAWEAVWKPNSMPAPEREQAMRAAQAALEALAPQDAIEGMLGVQMVGAHNAAMEYLRRSLQEGRSESLRREDAKLAAKLFSMYARQVEVLDKHRGKGAQKIVVEHVTLNASVLAAIKMAVAGGVTSEGEPAPALTGHVPGGQLALSHCAPMSPPSEVLGPVDHEVSQPVEIRGGPKSQRKRARHAG